VRPGEGRPRLESPSRYRESLSRFLFPCSCVFFPFRTGTVTPFCMSTLAAYGPGLFARPVFLLGLCPFRLPEFVECPLTSERDYYARLRSFGNFSPPGKIPSLPLGTLLSLLCVVSLRWCRFFLPVAPEGSLLSVVRQSPLLADDHSSSVPPVFVLLPRMSLNLIPVLLHPHDVPNAASPCLFTFRSFSTDPLLRRLFSSLRD